MISTTSAASATAPLESSMMDPRSRGSSREGFGRAQPHSVLGRRDRVGGGHVGLNGGGDLLEDADPPRQSRERKLPCVGRDLAPQVLVGERRPFAHDLPPERVPVVEDRERHGGEK